MTKPLNGSGHPADGQSAGATVSRRRIILILAGIMLGMLLAAVDQTIVGTAMPMVIADLNGLEHYAWVATSYMLASTVMVPIYGKLSDIYGRRPFFIGGMALFMAGSALSGASQDMVQLIVFRAVQGFGAAALLPLAQAIVGDIFPPAQRAKWQGAMMAIFGLATIVGPTTGGWITDNLGWRWTFYVNLPIGLLAMFTAGMTLPSQSRRQQHRIDYLGAMGLFACALPLLLAFSWAGTMYEWASPQVIGLLGFALLMFVAFLVIEKRADEPIISLSLFRNRIFTVSVLATFLVSGGMFGAVMFLPLFVQGVMGISATDSGMVLTPMMLGFMVSAIIGGQLISRTGRYKLIALIGLAIGTLGMALLSLMGADATQGLVIRNMIITGLGLGVTMSLFTIVVQNAFPSGQLGEVTAGLQFFRSIGGTISIAVLGSVMINRFHDAFQTNLPQQLRQVIPAEKLALLQNPQVLLSPGAIDRLGDSFASFGPAGQEMARQLIEAIRLSLADSISGLFVIGAVILLLSLASTLFLREIPLRSSHQFPTEGEKATAGSAAPGAALEVAAGE